MKDCYSIVLTVIMSIVIILLLFVSLGGTLSGFENLDGQITATKNMLTQ